MEPMMGWFEGLTWLLNLLLVLGIAGVAAVIVTAVRRSSTRHASERARRMRPGHDVSKAGKYQTRRAAPHQQTGGKQ